MGSSFPQPPTPHLHIMNLLVREKATADKKGRALSYKNNESIPADSNKCRIQQAIISKQTPDTFIIEEIRF